MDFTNEEKHRIDVLYGNDFDGITPEDMPLIQRWEQFKAVEDAKVQAELQAIKDKAESEIEENKATAELSRSILKEKSERSKARWEVLRNGK